MPTPKQLANLRPAKKGEVRNPEGGRTHNKELKAIRALTVQEVARVGELILQNDEAGLTAVRENEKSTVLQKWIAAVAIKAMKKGDAMALNALLDRFIGKVPNQVIFAGAVKAMRAPVDLTKLSTQELKELEKILGKTSPGIDITGSNG